jgi:hypothetical protein
VYKWRTTKWLNKVHSLNVTKYAFLNQLYDDPVTRHSEIVFSDFKMDPVFPAAIYYHIAAGKGRCHRFLDDWVHLTLSG